MKLFSHLKSTRFKVDFKTGVLVRVCGNLNIGLTKTTI